ncbi:hypothetical protein Tco_0002294 [Tanacetum coccineum]
MRTKTELALEQTQQGASYEVLIEKFQERQSSVTSLGDETSSGIVSDEEIDKQKLGAHYSYMAKIQEVSPEESSSTSQPLATVKNHDENDVFANVRRLSEQTESINDT